MTDRLEKNGRIANTLPPLPARPSLPLPPANRQAKQFTWEYVRDIFEAFSQRELALEMRVDALCFNAEKSLYALDYGGGVLEHARDDANPILGVRLLQRVDMLQHENQDLAHRVDELMRTTSAEYVQELKREIEGTYKHAYLKTRINLLPRWMPRSARLKNETTHNMHYEFILTFSSV